MSERESFGDLSSALFQAAAYLELAHQIGSPEREISDICSKGSEALDALASSAHLANDLEGRHPGGTQSLASQSISQRLR